MSHSQLQIFFIQISLLLIASLLCGLLMKKLGQAPVLGELLGGILLGPTVFGTLQPGLFNKIFPADILITSSVDSFNKVGLLFFMFVAGLEINFTHFRNNKLLVAATSILGGTLPFALGFCMVVFLPQLWGWTNHPMLFALFIGTALSISALPVIARILIDLGLINSRVGMTIMSSAMVNDIVGWAIFTFILSKLGNSGLSGDFFSEFALLLCYGGAVFISGRVLIQPLLRRLSLWVEWQGGILILVAALILLVATGAEILHLHGIFGAFLLGIALGHSEKTQTETEKHIYSILELFALNFFAPLYFVSIGLKVNFHDQFDIFLVLSLTFAACISKFLGAGIGGRIGGLDWREAIEVGVGLNARGAIGLILAAVALEHHLIDQRIFVALIFMAMATTLIGGFLLSWLSPRKAGQNS